MTSRMVYERKSLTRGGWNRDVSWKRVFVDLKVINLRTLFEWKVFTSEKVGALAEFPMSNSSKVSGDSLKSTEKEKKLKNQNE